MEITGGVRCTIAVAHLPHTWLHQMQQALCPGIQPGEEEEAKAERLARLSKET